jgi:hypothetical protein
MKIIRLIFAGVVLLVSSAAYGQAPGQAQIRQQQQMQNAHYWHTYYSQQSVPQLSAAEVQAQREYAEAVARNRARVRNDKRRDWWVSVVVDTATGAWISAPNERSEESARLRAMQRCEGVCWPVVAYANTCMAPAYGDKGGMYWADGRSKQAAHEAALVKCGVEEGGACNADVGEAICSGWKYAYSLVERMDTWGGTVADPKVEFSPGAEEFIAKPLQARGESTAIAVDDRKAMQSDRALGKLASAWTAVAVRQGGGAVGMHLGVNKQDASDTALEKCGASGCEVMLAYTFGQCGAIVAAPENEESVHYFSAQGEDKVATEESAMLACIKSGNAVCQTRMASCM